MSQNIVSMTSTKQCAQNFLYGKESVLPLHGEFFNCLIVANPRFTKICSVHFILEFSVCNSELDKKNCFVRLKFLLLTNSKQCRVLHS